MPPKAGKSGGSRGPTVSTEPRPAFGWSTVVNFEGLEKIRLVVVAGSNEWGPTKIWPGSWPRGEMATPASPFIHALLSGVLPPFSSFLIVVLSHYQIHALHLYYSSLVLLSAFAFLCEAFLGITPSVSLLCYFFSLELVSKEQCSGCASLKTGDASVLGALDADLLPEAEGFRRQWVQVETVEAGALFQPPSTPKTSKRGWLCEELNDTPAHAGPNPDGESQAGWGDDGDGGAGVNLSADRSSRVPLLSDVGLRGTS
ncbi:hypothetical protein D1007_33945 [Hordeum vulgare]|nr:hypothetical protein D1007_33945 [Hordeum vulgare]